MNGKIVSIEKDNKKCVASTEFCIKGTFDPEEITNILNIPPSKSWKQNDRIESKKIRFDAGARRPFSLWCCGYNESYNGDIARQIKVTIAPVKAKIPFIKEYAQKNKIDIFIRVICDATSGDITPDFSMDSEIIDFCKALGATIDVDLNIF